MVSREGERMEVILNAIKRYIIIIMLVELEQESVTANGLDLEIHF